MKKTKLRSFFMRFTSSVHSGLATVTNIRQPARVPITGGAIVVRDRSNQHPRWAQKPHIPPCVMYNRYVVLTHTVRRYRESYPVGVLASAKMHPQRKENLRPALVVGVVLFQQPDVHVDVAQLLGDMLVCVKG